MHSLLRRVGAGTAGHPWRTIAVWLTLLVATFAVAGTFGGALHDDYNVPGTASQAGTDLLGERFGARSGADARVVLHATDGTPISAAVLTSVSAELTRVPHIATVSPPRVSADGDTALIAVNYDIPVTDLEGKKSVDQLHMAADSAEQAGLQVELGGSLPENITAPSGVAELIGIAAALVILVVAFGSLLAAGVPLAVAIIGLGIGTALITLLCAVTDVSTTAPTVASMVGIGVGIDYALLLVTRQAEGLRSGLPVVEAAARATATAGASVFFAGLTVLASLLGLRLAGLSVYSSFGYATGLVVLVVMLTAVTLVPALAGLAGYRLLRKGDRAAARTAAAEYDATGVLTATAPARSRRTEAWAQRVGRRPLPWALGALLVLLALAAPALAMRTWPQDAGSQPTSNTTRRAYDLVAREFGPGANGPFVVAVDLDRVPATDLPAVTAALRAVHGVAGVGDPVFNQARTAAVIEVQPVEPPYAASTPQLLATLRDDVLPSGTYVTGLSPTFADISQRLSDRLWLVVGFVVALALVLLTAVFRSVVVALKAAVMNLLSVAAAYGAMVLIFQWGWGAEALGLPHAVPVSSWVPILMFAILFGLSMDYEVFLLGRIREDWLATHDAHGSVVRGLSRTAGVISSAAAIMVAVFIGFALDPDVTVKMIGVGMAIAVFLDATLTRLVLVPATMALLGKANWWIPSWLDRVLPHLGEPGGDAGTELSPAEPHRRKVTQAAEPV